MADAKLFQYYARQDVLPTFADFKSPEQLDRYAAQRRELFIDKLMLPPKLFHDAEVLEFGPDSGENALVFAGWGARMTLAEPNKQAHGQIRTYFERFRLAYRLRDLVIADVEGFCGDRRFDFVDAEGFIYTVQPTESWLRVFGGLLEPDGFAIVSYYERHGGFFELALKAIHAAGKALTGLPALEAAKLLFDAKWNSIPHTRSFESWLMDVLENPFARYRYFLDAATLCREADAAGFDIHAAWPSYRDMLDICWHKTVRSAAEKLYYNTSHLRRSGLSFLAGKRLYLVGKAETVDFITALLEQLAGDVDALIDDPLGRRLAPLLSNLATLRKTVETAEIFADDVAAIASFIETLGGLHAIFSAIARGDTDSLVASTNSDAAFIGTWGIPAHFLVLRKRSDTPQGS
jgi:Methyltransferase domain